MKRMKNFGVVAFMAACAIAMQGCSPLFIFSIIAPQGRGIDETVMSALPTEDGGFAVAGSSFSRCSFQEDIYLAGFDVNGAELWAKTIGGPGDDRIREVVLSNDGAFLLAGITDSYGQGGDDVYLLKIDGDGDVLWSKTYGNALDDDMQSIMPTADGGGVVLASRISLISAQNEWILMKIGGDGALVSETFLELPNVRQVIKIRPCANGDFALLIDEETEDYSWQNALVRLDAQGVVLWTRALPENVRFQDVTPCREGGFALMGTLGSPDEEIDQLYLYRADEDGNALWANAYHDRGYYLADALIECANGDYLLLGEDMGSEYTIRFDVVALRANAADGSEKWTARFGGGGFWREMKSAQELSDGTFLLGGLIRRPLMLFAPLPDGDAYLLHIDAEGVELMSAVSGEANDSGECIDAMMYWKEADAEPE
jgi:hypothetical protein